MMGTITRAIEEAASEPGGPTLQCSSCKVTATTRSRLRWRYAMYRDMVKLKTYLMDTITVMKATELKKNFKKSVRVDPYNKLL